MARGEQAGLGRPGSCGEPENLERHRHFRSRARGRDEWGDSRSRGERVAGIRVSEPGEREPPNGQRN